MKMIVIGASAGGFEPLVEILGALPASLTAAVLVLRHLSRDAPTILVELLAQRTALPVREATDGLVISPGVIYVGPPGDWVEFREVEGDHGTAVVFTTRPSDDQLPSTIDVSLEAAAEVFGEDLIAVVLSGALSDGTAGSRIVGHHGGTTIVQAPTEAKFDSMPRSVMRQESHDFALPAQRIGPTLVALLEGRFPTG